MARLHLDLSETHDELVETLMRMCDLQTKKDVVENALMLLGWAAKEAQNGRIIAAVDEAGKTYKEIQTPALIGAQRKRHPARVVQPRVVQRKKVEVESTLISRKGEDAILA